MIPTSSPNSLMVAGLPGDEYTAAQANVQYCRYAFGMIQFQGCLSGRYNPIYNGGHGNGIAGPLRDKTVLTNGLLPGQVASLPPLAGAVAVVGPCWAEQAGDSLASVLGVIPPGSLKGHASQRIRGAWQLYAAPPGQGECCRAGQSTGGLDGGQGQ